MEYNGVQCITAIELEEGGIMPYNTLKSLVIRGHVRRVRRGCRGVEALYSVPSLPWNYRCAVYKRYPDMQEKQDNDGFVDTLMPDADCLRFYAEYRLPDGRFLPEDKQLEYHNNCMILNNFGRLIDEADSLRLSQCQPLLPKGEFWDRAAAFLPNLRETHPNSLPTNARSLQRKYKQYKEEGPVVFIGRKWVNRNASKTDSSEQDALLLTLVSHHNNIDNVRIATAYNAIATMKGWHSITSSMVGDFRKRNSLESAAGCLGETRWRAQKTMTVRRSRPTRPFLYWTLDGWTSELLYQKAQENKRGHRTITYHNRLTLEIVLDPCCDYPIGYAIGTQESKSLIREALANALQHSRELTGVMLRTHQLQCDRYGLDVKMQGDLARTYSAVAKTVTPARVRNARAKVVEPYFKYLNTTYCQVMNNWSGFGVTTDPSRQPNPDAMNALRHTFPDEAGARFQLEKIIEMERARKREQFLQLLAGLSEVDRLEMPRADYLLHFGATTGRLNRLQASGLRPTILGTRRDYDCFDPTFRTDCAGEEWEIRYDSSDLDTVLAVNRDRTKHYLMEAKYVQPMALAERKEGDADSLARVLNYNKSLEENAQNAVLEARKVTNELIRSDEQIRGILGRLMITDSSGNHKDRRSDELAAIDIEEVEVPSLPEPKKTSKWDIF